MGSLCVMAMLVLSLALGIRSPVAHGPSAGIAVQLISSTDGALSAPHGLCPRGALSQSFGTCVSSSLVGIEQSTAGQMAPVDAKSSRFVIAADPAVAKLHESRLERPPRY
jgi:hypothetical protein